MKCPQCGTEFEGNVDSCFTCGCDFKGGIKDQIPKIEPKKIVIHTFFGGVLFVVIIIWSMLSYIGSYAAITFFLIYTVRSVHQIIKAKAPEIHRRKRWLAIVLMLFCNLYFVGQLIYRLDAPEITDDYTINDLRSADPKYNESYHLLEKIADINNPFSNDYLGLLKEEGEMLSDIYSEFVNFQNSGEKTVEKQIQNHKKFIEEVWQKTEEYRIIFEEISRSSEIADLSEPYLDYLVTDLNALKKLCGLYSCKVYLLCEEKEYEKAVEALILFDSVIRKRSINARPFITKMVCFALLSSNLQTANYLIYNDAISTDTLFYLKNHFSPIENKYVSLRNSILFEYLTGKNELERCFGLYEEKPIMGYLARQSILKSNSTLRVSRNHFIYMFEEFGETIEEEKPIVSVWPRLYPDLGPVPLNLRDDIPGIYKKYNPVGSRFLGVMAPAMGKLLEIKKMVLIKDDLFQWVLAQRMGEEGSLKARAYSDEYAVDVEKGLVFSVGPDGEAYTDDDIKLRIDPVVLGLNTVE